MWGRFCEAPARYLNVPTWLRKTPPPQDLYEDKAAWPQWNDRAEKSLREQLLQIAKLTPHDARIKLLTSEEEHAARRKYVWAELKEAPLAMAMKSLATRATVTKQSLAAGTVRDMAAAYQINGWTADAAALEALTSVQKPEDLKAIEAVLQTVYLPWIDEAAGHLQSQVESSKYLRGIASDPPPPERRAGESFVFVDGLRFDLAKSLESHLQQQGYAVESEVNWAALPSVTATATPAISPIRHLVRGQEVNSDFEPSVAATGQSLKGGYHFKKLLIDNGWQVLDRSETGDSEGSAWTEVGDVDHEGHVRGALLARHINTILTDIRDRIVQLLAAGWKSIRIVTDHGWLLMPGGLPKATLPSALADNTWGRCAAIKPGAVCNETLFPWYWNIDLSFALAPGVRCYREGVEYTHGGLSLQECLVLFLSVTTSSASGEKGTVEIQEGNWTGMRCRVVIDGFIAGLRLDIRTHAGNATSSLTMSDRPFKEDGTASVVLKDDSLADHEATVVVIDAQGHLVELGPRGTGKSHLFQQVSPYSHLISGGKATVARMFVNMANGQRGLVCQYDVVCFDEVSGVSFDQKDGVNIMKGYMESGEFSRGKESIRADGSIVLVGNFDVDVEHQQRVGHLFGPLPPEMRDDTAFMDRIHAYLPGWDIPKVSKELLTIHFGLVSDFLSECWNRLRNQSRVSTLQGRVYYGGALSGRDTNAVNKTVSGLLKLLYLGGDEQVPDEDLEWAVRIGLESRRRVKEQQKRIGAAEFRNTHFSYVLGNDGVEKCVSPPELQSEGGIGSDPLEPGQVWTITPGGLDESPGLYRIKVNEGLGSGVKVLNKPVPPAFRESVGYAEQNLYARAPQLVGDKDPRQHEFTVQLRAFDASTSGAKLGVSILVALCTSLLKKSTRGGLIIVGEINLGGSIEPIHNSVTLAEIAVEKGASALLMPVGCRRQLLDLSDDMATKVDIQFYSDARDALLKAIQE